MIFYEGFPRDSGATDMMDSSRLAGMMAQINFEGTPDLSLYVRGIGICVRCPITQGDDDEADYYRNFSRDQLMCLVGGLAAQGRHDICLDIYKVHEARGWFCQNGDWLSPSHRMHLKHCANIADQVTRLERVWFNCDIVWAAKLQPNAETNQLISMLLQAPSGKYLNLYCELRGDWQVPILAYWDSWRGELLLAYDLINYIHLKRGPANAA